jgi:hypothetical protein
MNIPVLVAVSQATYTGASQQLIRTAKFGGNGPGPIKAEENFLEGG